MCTLWFEKLFSGKVKKNEVSKIVDLYKKKLVEEHYDFDPEKENIEFYFFDDEVELIKFIWDKIHILDPAVLSGFNSHEFDYPYLYKRLDNLLEGKHELTAKVMSKLNVVNIYGLNGKFEIDIPDYPILDVQKLYKPRAEGGMNLGSSQES